MIFAAIDFETFYDKECSVTELGAEAYTRHPRYYAYLVAIKVGNREWCGDPKDPECPWHLLDGIPWVAHNAQFDYWVWKRLFESGDVEATPSQWFDTTAIPAYMQVGRDLANASWVLLGKEVSKDIRNKAKGKHWKDFDPTMQQLMIEYAMNDTRLCYELFEKHRTDVPDEEWALSEMTMFQGIHGVQINTDLLESHLKTVAEKQTELISQIPWKDNLKVAILSVGALRRQCEMVGVKDMPACTSKDSAEWSEWVGRVNLPFVEAFQQLRSLKKFLALLHKIKARVSPEGRLHFSLKYCGSRLTGRWAGDAGINMQNLPKGEVFGVNIRNLFIASPGHKLLNSDLSQIEPRCSIGTSLVLTDSGYKMIKDLSNDDKVFDGSEFVSHGGVIAKPRNKELVNVYGNYITTDHQVFVGDREKHDAESLVNQGRAHQARSFRKTSWKEIWQLARFVGCEYWGVLQSAVPRLWRRARRSQGRYSQWGEHSMQEVRETADGRY